MLRRAIPLVVAAALAAGAPARAEDGQGPADPDATLADLDLGTHWYGAEVSLDDLEGKVVLVELWGS